MRCAHKLTHDFLLPISVHILPVHRGSHFDGPEPGELADDFASLLDLPAAVFVAPPVVVPQPNEIVIVTSFIMSTVPQFPGTFLNLQVLNSTLRSTLPTANGTNTQIIYTCDARSLETALVNVQTCADGVIRVTCTTPAPTVAPKPATEPLSLLFIGAISGGALLLIIALTSQRTTRRQLTRRISPRPPRVSKSWC